MGQPAAGLNARPLVPSGDIAEWYVGLTVVDRPGVMSDVMVLAGRGINLALLQKAPAPGQVPIVLLTHMASESVITDAIDEITAFDEVSADFALLRVEAFE